MCSLVRMRIILSVAVQHKWHLSNIDMKTAFLETIEVQRNVHVVPLQDSEDYRCFVWLLLTASYGLISSNAIW